MKCLFNGVLVVALALVLAGCGGDCGKWGPPGCKRKIYTAPAPAPSSGGPLIVGGAASRNSSYAASIKVTNQIGGTSVTDAIVTVNGVTLPYDAATQSYAGSLVGPDAAGKFNLSVTANGATYNATENAFSSAPLVTVPVPFTAAAVNSISWTAPGGGTSAVSYLFEMGLDNGTSTSVYAPALITTTGTYIPANTTIAGTNYIASLAAVQFGASIANAAPGSNFAVGAYALQPKFTAQ